MNLALIIQIFYNFLLINKKLVFRFDTLYERTKRINSTISKFVSRKVTKYKLDRSFQSSHNSASHALLWQ